MKKVVFWAVLIILFALFVVSCNNSSFSDSISLEKEIYESSIDFLIEYEWSLPTCFAYDLNNYSVAATPRGLFFSSNNLMCYNPATGVVTTACGDALCTHDATSDCSFSDWWMWYEYPVTDGEYLYYIHRPIDKNTMERSKVFKLVRTDLYGFDKTVLYESENEIEHVTFFNNSIYFVEYSSKIGAVLYTYDINTNKIYTSKTNSDDGLVVSAFIPVNEGICYVYDGGLYKCDYSLNNSKLIISDFAYNKIYTDGTFVFYISKEGIHKTDLNTQERNIVYEVPDGYVIESEQVFNGGISFYLKRADSTASQAGNYDDWISSFKENTLFCYKFADSQVKTIELDEFYSYWYFLYGDVLIMDKYVKQPNGNGKNSGEYYVIDISKDIVTPRLLEKE